MPASQARLIAQALQRFEKLKPSYVKLLDANKAWRFSHARDSTIMVGDGKLVNWYKVNYAEEQALRQDSNDKLAVASGKARRRSWLVALEGVGLALLGYVIITQ
jgi:hypothetical protein